MHTYTHISVYHTKFLIGSCVSTPPCSNSIVNNHQTFLALPASASVTTYANTKPYPSNPRSLHSSIASELFPRRPGQCGNTGHFRAQAPGCPGSEFSISSSKQWFASLTSINHLLKGHLSTVNFLFTSTTNKRLTCMCE